MSKCASFYDNQVDVIRKSERFDRVARFETRFTRNGNITWNGRIWAFVDIWDQTVVFGSN
jgi:hypothetical protein